MTGERPNVIGLQFGTFSLRCLGHGLSLYLFLISSYSLTEVSSTNNAHSLLNNTSKDQFGHPNFKYAEGHEVDPNGYIVYCPCMGKSLFKSSWAWTNTAHAILKPLLIFKFLYISNFYIHLF